MPCYHPLQASFSLRDDGKKKITFSTPAAKLFKGGSKLPGDFLSLPCGKCVGCRLERSRQWAVRIMHEASLYEDNCFVTLTFDDENLAKHCKLTPRGYSLDRKHPQNFMKRLRQEFSNKKIRSYYCGEYGDLSGRPHYHVCLFNHDWSDKKLYKSKDSYVYYNSDCLNKLWPFGHAVTTDLTFDSAAYVARYCMQKVVGAIADDHYGGRVPEFGQASLKPGIAKGWLEQFGYSDCFDHDCVVTNGVKNKPPRYYDKFLESVNSSVFALNKERREALAQLKAFNSTSDRLAVREVCKEAQISSLKRGLDAG